MTVKTGTAWAGSFVTLDATGALSASADAAGVLYIDGVADAATVTITGSNPYKWSVTLPTLTAGQRVDMYITGTIATIATAGFVASEQADTALTSEVKTDTAAILADTGTDGVVLANDAITAAKFDESTAFPIKSADAGSTLIARAGGGSYNLTEINDTLITDGVVVRTIVDNAITADAVKADAVTKIQSGLALEATLTAIKGAGWSTETLAAIDVLIAAIKAKTDLIPATPAVADEYDAALAAIQADLDNPNQYKADVSGLATQASVNAIPTTPLLAANYTAPDNASIAAILEDTGTTLPATLATIAGYTDGIAGDVWSHATRTLTVPAVAMSDPEDGTTLTLYKDADINIEFTGLTIPTGAKKVVFTIKDNLDDADTAAALQATYQLTAVPAETHTLNYINSATPPTLTNPVTFTVTTDSVEFDMTAAAAYYLPRYERGYLKWDLKLITATTVQILQQGLVQILGTSTRTVA